MKIGCIIQARMGSSRLPEKVLMTFPYHGETPNLEWIIKRVSKSRKIEQIILATTEDSSDDLIEDLAEKKNISCFRGDVQNVLSRYYFAAKYYSLDVIVRVTGDCPCIDSAVIDTVIDRFLENQDDYCSNTLIRSYPHGLDVEVFSFEALSNAYRFATEEFEKEHVTPYIYKTKKDFFKISQVVAKEDYSNIRVTMDTYEDYMAICALYQEFPDGNFALTDLISLYENHPWLSFINNEVVQKKQFDSLTQELYAVRDFAKKQDLFRAASFIEGEIIDLESKDSY